MKHIQKEIIELDQDAHIALVYLDDEPTKNSMTLAMAQEFNQVLKEVAALEPKPRVMIITGKNGVFSSGGDFKMLESFADNTPEENHQFMNQFYRYFLEVRNMPFPVIAAVNGHAVGASFALALACDIRYLVKDAKYALNFVKLGIHPGMGASWLVKQVAGMNQAQELLFTGRFISGDEASQRGLCHGVFTKEEILDQAMNTAREIAKAGPLALRLLKENLYQDGDLETALNREARAQAQNYATQDYREAMRAIPKKETPKFRDH